MNKDQFKEYIKQTEPSKKEKSYVWSTAIGLQEVDGLKPSKYLIETAVRNIEGDISLEQAQEMLNNYYEERPSNDDRTEEADKVSIRIAKILSEKAFTFSPREYIAIHKKLFTGIYTHAGQIRDYNITKKEWVLNGDTVTYGNAYELDELLEYDFQQEKKFKYNGLSLNQIIEHLATFISRLWQIHAFCEGNTRTTAVFFIKYLRTLGFNVTNDVFAENAWYFRNALVRANYNDLANDVYETTEYLEVFLKNLLAGEKNKLHSKALHITNLQNQQKISETIDFNNTIELSLIEEQIVEILMTNAGVTQKMLAEQINVSERTIKRKMQEMRKKGWISRENGKRTGHWLVHIRKSKK